MRAQRSDDVRPGDLPAFLRVEEVARILRISRSAAYELVNAWLATGGETGLPAVRLGRSLRVPRTAVERLLSIGDDGDDAA
jgi:excisionase family DNA binding protein